MSLKVMTSYLYVPLHIKAGTPEHVKFMKVANMYDTQGVSGPAPSSITSSWYNLALISDSASYSGSGGLSHDNIMTIYDNTMMTII